MKIVRCKNVQVMENNGKDFIYSNMEKKSWLKLNSVAKSIIDEVHDCDEMEAINKIVEKYKVNDKVALAFIDNLLNHGILERQMESKYIELIDPIENIKNIFESCTLNLTNKCNLSCKYCYISANDNLKNELSTSKMKSLIRRLAVNKIVQLVFLGGEPLFRQDFQELVIYARKMFPELGISTNATLITEENVGFIVKNIDKIQVSVDSGIKNDHDQLRGEGTFDRTINGIKLLKKHGHKNITITPTINKLNIDNIGSIVALAKELEVFLDPKFFVEVGRGKENAGELGINNDDMMGAYKKVWEECKKQNYEGYSVEKFFNKATSPKEFCSAGKRQICVDVNGDIFPCTALIDENMKLGNVFEKVNIQEIIENSIIKKQVLDIKVDDIAECKKCNLKYFCAGGCIATRNINSGKLCEGRCSYNKYKNVLGDFVWRNNDYSLNGLEKLI